MQVFIAQLINGLSLGSVYVLLVTGFNLLLLAAMVIHFSYPQLVVFSMYIVWIVLDATGDNLWLGILAGLASSVLLNVLVAPLFRKKTSGRGETDINSTLIMSMAIGMIITDILSHSFNRGLPVAFPEALTGGEPFFRAGLISVMRGQIWSLAIGLAAVGGLFFLLFRTRAGRAFRAIAEDPAGARLVGIPIAKTGLQSHALSGALGGAIAVLLAMLLHSASPGLGEQIAQKVLAVSIVAGLGNLVGGLAVGLALGVLEALAQGYLPGNWSNAIAFAVMLAVVLVKPRGLFGGKGGY